MKFGKRLAAEAARRWRPYYLDYKACKRAIQQDVHALGTPCMHILVFGPGIGLIIQHPGVW